MLRALLAIVLILAASPALAVNCHCFTERAFDASDPFSSDPYVMATARNGLLAAAVGMEKADVVRARMKGLGETDLWIALRAAITTGTEVQDFLDGRDDTGSWAKAFKALSVDPAVLGGQFAAAVEKGDDQGAAALVDEVLLAAYKPDPAVLASLRGGGADNAQATVALHISSLTSTPAEELFAAVKGGKISWSKLLVDAGGDPEELSEAIMKRVKLSKTP